ncbi:hypothetical protein [Luteibacter yeojuensis]|uniref:Tetratricopeptide repeat protein n=1 Tax=Luteibacter yeojuensis TaxID=345309 RepID=A0A7X5TRD4_9GAMM|nr:hypothetical protein [Luteibacter yeojuensis]NID16759.1 hypothetical protein [Luteibacter yeojuensis]
MYTHNTPIAAFQRTFPWLAVVAVLALTIVIYTPGLHGPFLLDDIGNLEPLKRWADGYLGWQGVVFDNRSGPGGRPLSMLTFLANGWLDPHLHTFGFKAVNLGIHIATGVIAFALASLIFLRSGIDRSRARWLAAFAAVTWLWLPMQVSTVLYVIQRMAQLATLLMFVALTLYLSVRPAIERGSRAATLALWFGLPVLTLLAASAKETGLLALPLAAVLEYTLFDRATRPRQVTAFFGLTVALPVCFGLLFIAVRPQWILRGYFGRDFTLDQRLMTEPRVLWSYLQTTFFPVGSHMGLFHDTYPISTSPWKPWTTVLAAFAWLTICTAAIVWRRRMPLFALGVAGYLVAHSLEAGPISLELYFEHRNYGAALFALIAVVGLVRGMLEVSGARQRVRWIVIASAFACVAIFAMGTWSQASGWKDEDTFYATQYGYNPDSPRLLSNLTGRAMLAHDLPSALWFIEKSESNSPDSERVTSTIWRFLAYCEVGGAPAPDNLYEEFGDRARGRVTTYSMVGWELLARRLSEGCKGLDSGRLTTIAMRWLNDAPQPASAQPIWRTRFNTGRMLAESGDIENARAIVRRAWIDSDHNNGIGVTLFQLDASLGDIESCRDVLTYLSRSEGGSDLRLTEAIRTFRKAIDSGEIGGPAR